MALLKDNVVVYIDGKSRRIAAIRENSKGDVYISFFGLRLGEREDGPVLQEQRLSLHPSWASKTPTSVIKLQTRGKNGDYYDAVAATGASRNVADHLFHPALSLRLSDLSAACYDIDVGKRKRERDCSNSRTLIQKPTRYT